MKYFLWLALPLFAAPEALYQDPAGKFTVRYAVEGPTAAPTTDPQKQLGLILCFPEHDRPTGDELLPVRESLRRQGLSQSYVLLGVHPQGQKFGDIDHEPLRQMIAWAQKNYPINPRRIYLYGKGEGAKISGEFGTQHPLLITSAVTYSWGWWKIPSEITPATHRLPTYYTVLGMRDLLTHIQTVRDTVSRMNAKGLTMIYREFDDLGARTYHPPSNDDGLAWALRQRNPNLPLSAGETDLLKNFTPAVAHGYFPSLALVGGDAAGKIVQKYLANPDAKLRAAAVETCSQAIFSDAVVEDLGKTLVDPDEKVRAVTLKTLATLANWRSQAAQRILISYVKAPQNPLDRMSAIDALGYAVRYQVKGYRQDPAVFAALIQLLQDPDEEARVMAANILAPIRDKDFRGDAGRPEAKSPAGGWAAWLGEITAKQRGYLADFDDCQRGAPATYCEAAALLGKQPAEAFAKTKQAAEMGWVPAQALLGMLYANGMGVEQDYLESANWWAKAAAQGHALAAQNLARNPRRPQVK
ncbi:MAG: hypothetical protein K2X03_06410 [Bryobacteraceae bacterium]|nr:hypothetical protein [Bryobacteraceae bacterium]